MRFHELALRGLYVVEVDRLGDDRGHFVRTYCSREFASRDLDTTVAQCNLSYNRRAGTVRGLHYQAEPHGEIKLVRCSRGVVYDVAVDLRPNSATFGQWESVELSEANGQLLYIPRGFAHGFQTLADSCELTYQMSTHHVADAARGVRWNDPSLGISWPRPEPAAISERDRRLPLLAEIDARELPR